MFHRYFFQPRRYKFSLKPGNARIIEVVNKIQNYEMPERLKGTFVERLGKYWKNMYLDYKHTAQTVVQNCKDQPIRSSIYASILGSCYYLSHHNPDELTFREDLLLSLMKVMQVGEATRNPVAADHVRWLEQCYDEGIIRRLNLGILSLIWVDNYDKACSLYKTTCTYLKPRYITLHQRIVDIGILDKWWILESKMKDYDVNEAEFSNVQM